MKSYIWGAGALAASLAISCTAPAFAQSTGGNTVLKTNMVRGYVTVYVNGQQVGKFGKKSIVGGNGIASTSLNRYVKGGQNTLRLVWSEQLFPTGEIHISHAASGGNFREITGVDLGVNNKGKGDKTLTFVLPNTAGKLPGAGGQGGGTAPASDPATKPSGQVGPGSRTRQTLMNANITRGHITVFVNDKKVGSYASGLVPLDISNYVRSGANNLRLEWDESDAFPTGSIRISYAVDKSKFRTVGEYDLGVFTKKKSGKNSVVTFNLP